MLLPRVLVLGAALVAVACGGDDDGTGSIDAAPTIDAFGGSGDADRADANLGALTVTSSLLDDGSLFLPAQTCDGANTSPDLSWTGAPEDAASFAIVLVDETNSLGHWAIWNISGNSTGVRAEIANQAEPAMPTGALQAQSYDGETFGYLGPCPGTTHLYRFTVHALDVATLPGVTTASTIDEVAAAAVPRSLAVGSLTSSYPGD